MFIYQYSQDYKGLELPVNELPMFAFPNDLRLTYGSRNRFPLPVFFTFVFTDQNGGHLYAACLRFYEVVSYDDLLPVFNQVYGETPHVRFLIVWCLCWLLILMFRNSRCWQVLRSSVPRLSV